MPWNKYSNSGGLIPVSIANGWTRDDPTRLIGSANLAYDADTQIKLMGYQSDISSVVLDLYNPLSLTGNCILQVIVEPLDGSGYTTFSQTVSFTELEEKVVEIAVEVSGRSLVYVSRDWSDAADTLASGVRLEKARVA
jgi:glutathionylspermidine synthase